MTHILNSLWQLKIQSVKRVNRCGREFVLVEAIMTVIKTIKTTPKTKDKKLLKFGSLVKWSKEDNLVKYEKLFEKK